MIHWNCNNLAQQVMQAFKSKKQVVYKPKTPKASISNRIETPLPTGMPLHCYHATRSKQMIDILEQHAGVGASYKSTLEHVSLTAGEVKKNIEFDSHFEFGSHLESYLC